MVATELGVSPTTATSVLGKLREAGFAEASREGRAYRWRLNTDNPALRSWLEEMRGELSTAAVSSGMSPYSTGGGGITFERKVAVQYLAHLLVGDGAVELGDGRFVVSVTFQGAPEHSVDDLVVCAARADESEPSLVLAIGARRAPDLVPSDESTAKLFSAFVREVINAPVDGPEHRVALVVAGPQDHAEQLALLADLAAVQMDAAGYFGLARAEGKFLRAVRERLVQIEKLVKLALIDLGFAGPSQKVVEYRTWELLSRLTVIMPRLETPHEADWAAVTNSLIPVARGSDLCGASRLRDRLVALADEYPPKGAKVDLSLLRRDAHEVVDDATRRHRRGWKALAHLHERSIASVREEIVSGDHSRTIHINRSDTAAELLAVVDSANAAVVAHGESGVGKSALVVGAATGAVRDGSRSTQTICINLRHLPSTSLALESHLGTPLAGLLGELGAPRRLLVIDAADAISEGMREPLRYLVDAAIQADVKIIAVAANDTEQLVRDTVAERCGGRVAEFLIPPLTDPQIDDVVAAFGELSALATNPRSRELLRKPVVVDLLVRGGGLSAAPLSDADAMQQVWAGLVRRHEQADRGTPDARHLALLRLADLVLCGGDALDVVGSIDPAALDGLRHDGLLRTSPDDPFKIGPEFAHDEVRRYAVARLLLASDNPTSKLVAAGVPRWALGAARLVCQARLAAPATPSNPLHGRLDRLQQAFDDLVEAGHGERWADVPGEALLTMGDPGSILREAWAELDADRGAGLKRLCRLVDQRLRDETGLVRTVAVEPVVSLLLDGETPWQAGDHVRDLLRDWLRALVCAGTATGSPLRVRLHDRLIAACAEADRRWEEERAAAAAARAARSPEEIEEERRSMALRSSLLYEIGFPRSRRPGRPDVPREITDETTVEFLALLGPDLGEDGESVLRRVADDAPAQLHPAVEELFTGRALATYRRGFLAELTEAYYLDEDGTGVHDYGIRDHHSRGFSLREPLAAWYRGPFMPLFQSDFHNGVAVLNRMLNHAALTRARVLAGHDSYRGTVDDHSLSAYNNELDITGTRRTYVGDGHVWLWYRGSGVGPYPCMSALQALERVCDQLIEIEIPLPNILDVLLAGCENLAMVGLVVGLLVRHLERADRLLDSYLAEPIIWHEEFSRVVHETNRLAAAPDHPTGSERRRWSLRETAMLLALRADGSRADELRLAGQQLVVTAERQLRESSGEADATGIEEQLATVRAWASCLDRSTYETRMTEEGLLIQSNPPEEIVQALQNINVDVRRAQEATRLMLKYHINLKRDTAQAISAEDLAADLAVAQDLHEAPSTLSARDRWDTPAAVAAVALEAHLLHNVAIPEHALRFAVGTVLRVGEGEASPLQFEFEETYFEQAADRSAARVLPLLLTPSASAIRALIDGDDGSQTYQRATAAASNLARAVAHEVRLHLARGLDRLWEIPCPTDSPCHHETALHLSTEAMRDCAFDEWDRNTDRRPLVDLDDPVVASLAATDGDAIYVSRLGPATRALAPAAVANICVSKAARDLLDALLSTHRRALLAYERDMDHRGTHALIAARALLTITAEGDDTPIFDHILAYRDNPTRLDSFLKALSAAAEESPARAATARRMWPAVVDYVIGLKVSGHTPFEGGRYTRDALPALIPNPAAEVAYLYREVETQAIAWWEPAAWQTVVEQWLVHARGNPACVDQVVSFLSSVEVAEQARLGMPWIEGLVLPNPDGIANRSFLVTSWLIEIRPAAADAGLLQNWQRVVDSLVVAGISRLASYSE
ncbi:winged helix-turn-helix domain-containing protein [Candidatus Protofrankia californiensis]|uniref:winged helix-turn-helix domain-containing protein n=1 Tax=Candidatus Protofrankia californiensis TaxID=1839754 RepID=UPI001041501A|nr:winged helix-turn-helix domain-containing protein [Candidatus Protofrankia californiensis]